ncbi:MAG TPA: hypothetical protein VM597_40025 [Gemmataceae bacterium]|nr:hypothetical protein [Gemmataceae bacterium]
MTDHQTGPDEATRRTIFADLIGKQDKSYSVAASRALMAKLHGLTPAAVRAIEDEGVANDWPPLGD